MTPETPISTSPQVETAPIKAEKKLTPEQLRQNIFNEILRKYWVDLKEATCNQTMCSLEILKTELQITPAEKIIEEKSREIYRSYLENNWVEKIANLDSLTKSIESERLQNMKNEFEKILNPALEKYDFLNLQTKEFVKIGIANSMLKWPSWQILDSLVWSMWKFMADLSQMDIKWLNKLLSNKSNEPKDAWRTLSLEEQFSTNLKKYLDKFEEINKKFNENNITNPTQKQNIISNVDWFRNPALIEAWVDWLDISKIDLTKTEKKELDGNEKKNLVEYMMKSRENLVELSRKMSLWDKWADLAYDLIWNWWVIWKWVEKLLEIILKLPIIWKIFATFLWLDPNNALDELKENSANFKYLSSLKSLWASKNEKAEKVPWKKPFENIDLSNIRFNLVKNEMKEVKTVFGETKEEELAEKWKKAFNEWIKTPDWLFKLELWNKKEWKLTSLELKEILRNWLTKLNDKKQEKQAEEDAKKKRK